MEVVCLLSSQAWFGEKRPTKVYLGVVDVVVKDKTRHRDRFTAQLPFFPSVCCAECKKSSAIRNAAILVLKSTEFVLVRLLAEGQIFKTAFKQIVLAL